MGSRRPEGEREFNPLDDSADLISQVVSGNSNNQPLQKREVPQTFQERVAQPKQNIITALKNMVNNAKPRDELFFLYSGHGTQIADISGDELISSKDSVLVPIDFEVNGFSNSAGDNTKLFTLSTALATAFANLTGITGPLTNLWFSKCLLNLVNNPCLSLISS